MKRLKVGRSSKEDRMNFVKYWAHYVRTHADHVWSKQQKIIIDSQIMNARNYRFSPKKYLKIKNEFVNQK